MRETSEEELGAKPFLLSGAEELDQPLETTQFLLRWGASQPVIEELLTYRAPGSIDGAKHEIEMKVAPRAVIEVCPPVALAGTPAVVLRDRFEIAPTLDGMAPIISQGPKRWTAPFPNKVADDRNEHDDEKGQEY